MPIAVTITEYLWGVEVIPQTWLDGNDSDNAPGLNVEWYCCKCAGDIDAGAYNTTHHTPDSWKSLYT